MSFILDALKKVEQEKRVDPASVERAAVSSRRSARGQLWAMMAIALASAALTAALLGAFLKSGWPAPGSQSAERPVVEASSVAPPAERSQVVRSAAGPDGMPTGRTESVAAPAPRRVAPVVSAGDETRVVDEADAVVDSSRPTGASAEPEPEAERAMPVHIVGRESAALETLRQAAASSTPPEPAPEGHSPGGSAPPEGLPDLVLQGTSVLDGAPVAVISERRVFEGDRIEGATVVRISEREVELVFEGHRFTLTL